VPRALQIGANLSNSGIRMVPGVGSAPLPLVYIKGTPSQTTTAAGLAVRL
jgi:hypothetical protein